MWLFLIVAWFLIVILNREPDMIIELRSRYHKAIDILRKTGDPKWKNVLHPAILTGMNSWDKSKGPIGSNVNKGYEIYICLDGNDVNSAMFVLIHELAHMSVEEYGHTPLFWENFKKLKQIFAENGIYSPQGMRQYCGDRIVD